MRPTLFTEGIYRNESDIINLDNTDPDTHWMTYMKRPDRVVYFV